MSDITAIEAFEVNGKMYRTMEQAKRASIEKELNDLGKQFGYHVDYKMAEVLGRNFEAREELYKLLEKTL